MLSGILPVCNVSRFKLKHRHFWQRNFFCYYLDEIFYVFKILISGLAFACKTIPWCLVPCFQIFYQSADDTSILSVLVVNGSLVTAANVTGLRKFVFYNIQMLAFTSIGDGVLSTAGISVKTFEDGEFILHF